MDPTLLSSRLGLPAAKRPRILDDGLPGPSGVEEEEVEEAEEDLRDHHRLPCRLLLALLLWDLVVWLCLCWFLPDYLCLEFYHMGLWMWTMKQLVKNFRLNLKLQVREF